METDKPKKTGRPKKAFAKRHVFAFRFDDVQLSVIDWMFEQFAQEGETKSELVARLFTSFLAANLAEKQLRERTRIQGIPLTVQYRREHTRTVNEELKKEIQRRTAEAKSGNLRRFDPSAVPCPNMDEGIPISGDNISEKVILSAENTNEEPEGIPLD